MKRNVVRPVVFALAFVSLMAGCVAQAAPTPARMAGETARLEQIVPLLEELEVSGFIAEDGCRWVLYERGRFFDGGKSCQPGDAVPFDEIARADHARLAEAIEVSGAPTRRILDATLGPDGHLQNAAFLHSAHPFPDQWEYLYDPGNLDPKVEGGPLKVQYTRVDGSWWFMSALDD